MSQNPHFGLEKLDDDRPRMGKYVSLRLYKTGTSNARDTPREAGSRFFWDFRQNRRGEADRDSESIKRRRIACYYSKLSRRQPRSPHARHRVDIGEGGGAAFSRTNDGNL